jgi:hypothetical protein
LRPDEFSGGEAPGQAKHVLRQLGFTVVKKDRTAEDEEGQAGKDWSGAEVGLLVADYFAMLQKELLGKPYSKAGHRRALAPRLVPRGSARWRSCRISRAGLPRRAHPWCNGNAPRL